MNYILRAAEGIFQWFSGGETMKRFESKLAAQIGIRQRVPVA